MSAIFCHQLDLIDCWNIWGSGDPLVGKEGNTVEPSCFMDPSGKHPLNINLLFDIKAAEKTLCEYFEKNHLLEEENRVHRSEKGDNGVSLRATPARVSNVDQA